MPLRSLVADESLELATGLLNLVAVRVCRREQHLCDLGNRHSMASVLEQLLEVGGLVDGRTSEGVVVEDEQRLLPPPAALDV
jgi:hypothetical protein